MTGRGSGKLIRADSNPSVTIGLSLSTSPSALSVSSEEPFYVVITARILSSPQPERPITLWTHLSPLDGLSTRAFENIKRTTNEDKRIEIFPHGWPQYHWDHEDIPRHGSFVTVPPRNQGSVSVNHRVPPDAIRDANVAKGERYRVQMTDLCLGTKWWTFGAREDLDGMRLRMWQPQALEEAEMAEETTLDVDLRAELEQERRAKYGDRPTIKGENPVMLAMVPEVAMAEFEVISLQVGG
ncbi:hypothetical protein LTR85_009301 [Meristemomyces frigidus]|nr:hypothetical protein LTR85_009301 [Meristemomyces frigidus]